MAASPFTVLNSAKKKFLDGTIDLDTHTFKAALYAYNAGFTPSATTTVDTYAELATAGTGSSNVQVSGTGYTNGGATLTGVTLVESGGTVTFDAADVVWPTSTITAKGVVIYDDSSANKDIIGFMDLNTDSASAVVASSAGEFKITWNASGIFSIA